MFFSNRTSSENTALLKEIFDSLDAAIWSLDKKTNRLTVSAGVEKVFGYTRQHFLRNPFLWRDVTLPEDLTVLQAFVDTLDSGRSSTVEHRITRPNGDIKWVQCFATPILSDDQQVIRINGVIHDITEQRAAKQALETERLLIRDMLDTVDVAVWSYDKYNSKLVYISETLNKITGYPAHHFHNIGFWNEIIHPEDVPIYERLTAKVRQGKPDDSEYRIVTAGGDICWVQVRIIPCLNSSGEIVRVDGVVMDITSRKTMQEALQRSEQRYKSLFDHHSDLIIETDMRGKMIALNKAAESAFAKAYIADGPKMWANMLGTEGKSRAAQYFEQAKSGQSQLYEISTDHGNGIVRQWEVKQVPIYINGEVTGVFAVGTDLTEKKKIERDLAETQSKYRLVAENTKDLLGLIDVNGTFLYASPSFERVLGRDYRLLTGTSGFDFIHPDDRNIAYLAMSDGVESGASRQLRLRFLHADGRTVFIDMLGTPVRRDDGDVEGLVLVGRDITEEVMFEKKLEQSEERYKRLIELSPQAMISHKEGNIVYINTAGLKLLGASGPEQLLGTPVLHLLQPGMVEMAKQRISFAKSNKFVGSLEYKLKRLDGEWIDAEVTGIYDEQSQTNLIVLYDVTERKKMEKALLESEERYRRMVELSPLAIAVYKEQGLAYLNPAGLKLIGSEGPEYYSGIDPLDFVHPDDREMAAQRIENTIRAGYSPSAEYRIVRVDGNILDVSVSSIYDPLTSSIQLVLRDISARKQAQTALTESEELNRLLVELSPEAVILHCGYKIIYTNPAALALLGATDDLNGMNILEMIHPENHDSSVARLQKVYEGDGRSPFVEQKIIRVDGYVVDVEVVSAPILYKGANAGITLIRDITERKRADDRRKHAEQTLMENQDRYYRLQTSLDRFSSDLFGVMKIQELERRLVKEVRDVIKAAKVSLIEVERNDKIFVKAGNHVPGSMPSSLYEWHQKHPVCEIVDTPDGHFLKLGEIRGKIYLLCISEKPPQLTLQPKRVWLETICRYVSVLYDNFRVIEDLTKELEEITNYQSAPSWLLRILFKISEHERKRLSQDLHDAALQEQIIWYRKLDQISSDPSLPSQFKEPMSQIMEGLLNVIYQIRITCNELRPPMLKQEGLVTSLETLFEFTQIRANYAIHFDATEFHSLLNDDQVIGLYRIVQEMLSNATKHSHATNVAIRLITRPDWIELNYEDNGIGMDVKHSEGPFKSMGVYGMKERVRSLNGSIEISSSPNNGLHIFISIPISAETRNN